MILDQFGREVATVKKPDTRPIAAAPILDTWRDYASAGLTPSKLASLLKEADSGDVRRQAELFGQMEEKDAHLLGEVSKRRNAILDVPFELSPATENDPRDAKIAEFVEQVFADITDWEDVLSAMQDAVGKGYAGLEINWDVSAGQAVPQSLDFIEPKRFQFRDNSGYLRKVPLLLTDADPMGIEIPAWKMLFHRYGGKSGHPARSGVHRVCAWMYLFRNYSLKDWVAFLEVFGMPLRLGKYDAGASKEDKDALVTAIRALGSDAAGIISKNTEIEFIESVKKGAAGDNPFEALANFCAKEISKALLGQTLTADVGDTGSYAASQTHNEVRLDLAKADTRSVAATIRDQLIRPIVGFNFGWDADIPKYAAAWEKEDDLKAKADWVTMLADRGAPIPVSFIRDEFSIPEPEDGEQVLGTFQPPIEAKRRIVAKSDQDRFSQDEVDKLSRQGAIDAERAISALLAPVLAAVEGAESLESLGEAIYKLYPKLDSSEFQELLARAMFAAGLTGYAAAESAASRGEEGD